MECSAGSNLFLLVLLYLLLLGFSGLNMHDLCGVAIVVIHIGVLIYMAGALLVAVNLALNKVDAMAQHGAGTAHILQRGLDVFR